jgi:predicted membrane chloride channel (bestrophin family)
MYKKDAPKLEKNELVMYEMPDWAKYTPKVVHTVIGLYIAFKIKRKYKRYLENRTIMGFMKKFKG